MSAAEDGTIDLLTIHEARLLTTLGPNMATPQQLAGQLTWTWQMVTTVMTRLRKIGLVSRNSYPKMTFYRLTGDGLSLLPLIKARTTRTGRFLTSEDLTRDSRCPDGGYCHGSTLAAGSEPCPPGRCLRVRTSGPLSGVFPGDVWPEELAGQP